ncbi:MAG: aminoglycoside phosphotransferase [SAR86 cluster bacterium]|uniref:Aminoglycoside phosphotransferase n=1 Tax=SAR86 cluster bacterium TaxID=2030880 RepID=A0A520M825_9GAMM|nr:MAG: aminoglycoside phosphotransferase [SAR86 cluster bacterium]
MKESEIIELTAQCGFEFERAIALKLEASGREYWRLVNKSESLILCFLDPLKGDHLQFTYLADIFKSHNINAPEILMHNPKLGVTIQEDLGDNDLLEILNDSNKYELVKQSLELLNKIQVIEGLNINTLNQSDLESQINLFSEFFCGQFLKLEADDSIRKLSEKTIINLNKQPQLNCHFDYERRNLILSKDMKINIIDFQDLCIGPIGIDLAGILLDHYQPFDEVFVKESLVFYKEESNLDLGHDELFECFRWGGIQRNLRILGTLSRLYIDQNRSFRLNDLTMILQNLIDIIPAGWDCRDFLIDTVKPSLHERLKSI